MNKRFNLRQVLIIIAATLSLVGLSGCFLFSDPTTYGVNLWLSAPEGLEPFCYGVDLTATFGESSLLDIQVDQTDPSQHGIEGRQHAIQRYYAGMPLVVDVVCTDPSGGVIGRSLYEGGLADPGEDARFTLINYPDPQIDFSTCIPPTTATGVQMCAIGYGFNFQ